MLDMLFDFITHFFPALILNNHKQKTSTDMIQIVQVNLHEIDMLSKVIAHFYEINFYNYLLKNLFIHWKNIQNDKKTATA